MKFKLALAQCRHPKDSDVVALVDGYLAKAHDAGASLVVFPESLMTPFEMPAEQFLSASEELDGPFCSAINELARKHNLWVVYTANERNVDGSKPFSTAVVVDNGGEVRGSYRKTHLLDTDFTRESDKIMSGYELFAPLETPFCKLGLGICYDLRFPELARAAALAECDVLVFPSAWVDGPGKVRQWKTLLSARAIENEMFVAGVSRCDRGFGTEARDYTGNSCVFDPLGNEVAAAGPSEDLVIAEIDTEIMTRARAAMPVLDHRHVELYGSLLERNAQKYGVVLDEGGEPVEAYEGSLKYIFASYSHRDISIVYPILARLQRMGFRVWYDPGIQPGYEWEPFVMEHVDNCTCCLFFSSASSLSSMYCQREVVAARKLDKDILVINLDGSDFSWLAQYNLELLQHVFRSDYSDDMALTDAIAAANIVQPCKDTYEIEEQEYESGRKDVTLVSYLGGSVEIIVPDGVTHIGEAAFMAPNVRRVVLPEGVVNIGSKAFMGCGALEEITLPTTLKTIGNDAFSKCAMLKDISFPESLGYIGRGAFANCIRVSRIKLVNPHGDILSDAFRGCVSLEEAEIAGKSIQSGVFLGCQSLKRVKILEGIRSIGGHAFENCVELTDLELPNTLQEIYEDAFRECSKLFLNLPPSIVHISPGAFFDCAGYSLEDGDCLRVADGIVYSADGTKLIRGTVGNRITEINVPEGVAEIAKEALGGAHWITAVHLPSTLTAIGEWAFGGCQSLRKLHIPENVRTIGKRAFVGAGITEVNLPDGLQLIDDSAFSGCNLTSICIPATVTTIGRDAFGDCTNLDISIPSSVEHIGDGAFKGCNRIAVYGDSGPIMLKDGMLFCDNGRILAFMPGIGIDNLHVVIPEGVEEILDGALWINEDVCPRPRRSTSRNPLAKAEPTHSVEKPKTGPKPKTTVAISLPDSLKRVGRGALRGLQCNVVVHFAGKELALQGWKREAASELISFIDANCAKR